MCWTASWLPSGRISNTFFIMDGGEGVRLHALILTDYHQGGNAQATNPIWGVRYGVLLNASVIALPKREQCHDKRFMVSSRSTDIDGRPGHRIL